MQRKALHTAYSLLGLALLMPFAAHAQFTPVSSPVMPVATSSAEEVQAISGPAITPTDAMLTQAARCDRLFPRYERKMAIPVFLLKAIALTESGTYHAPSRRLIPWPWTVQAEGQGYFLSSKEEAITLVQNLRSKGVQSIDVGCMQVNLMYHGNAFASLQDAFDPEKNLAYAAGFLREHFQRTQSWHQAVADYHSRTPQLGNQYAGKVIANWNQAMTDSVTLRAMQESYLRHGGQYEAGQYREVEQSGTIPLPRPGDLDEAYVSHLMQDGATGNGSRMDEQKRARVMQRRETDVVFVQPPQVEIQTATAVPADQAAYQPVSVNQPGASLPPSQLPTQAQPPIQAAAQPMQPELPPAQPLAALTNRIIALEDALAAPAQAPVPQRTSQPPTPAQLAAVAPAGRGPMPSRPASNEPVALTLTPMAPPVMAQQMPIVTPPTYVAQPGLRAMAPPEMSVMWQQAPAPSPIVDYASGQPPVTSPWVVFGR